MCGLSVSTDSQVDGHVKGTRCAPVAYMTPRGWSTATRTMSGRPHDCCARGRSSCSWPMSGRASPQPGTAAHFREAFPINDRLVLPVSGHLSFTRPAPRPSPSRPAAGAERARGHRCSRSARPSCGRGVLRALEGEPLRHHSSHAESCPVGQGLERLRPARSGTVSASIEGWLGFRSPASEAETERHERSVTRARI